MPDRSQDWLTQACRNLSQAADSAAANRHEWACFAAQQAAEIATHALHVRAGQRAHRYPVRRLLEGLPQHIVVADDLANTASTINRHSIQSLDPRTYDAGAAGEHYGPKQSEEAIRCARQIFEFCRSQMA